MDDPNHFRLIGVIVSLIGYGLFFWAVIGYESAEEQQKMILQIRNTSK